LKIALLAELFFNDSELSLIMPVILVPHSISGHSGASKLPTSHKRKDESAIIFQLSFDVQQPHLFTSVSSPTHSIVYSDFYSISSTQNGLPRAGRVTFGSELKPEYSLLSTDHLVLSFSMADSDSSVSSPLLRGFPAAIVERIGDKNDSLSSFASMLLFRPVFAPQHSPTELQIIIDPYKLPLDDVVAAIKTAMKSELGNGSRLFFNVALIIDGHADPKFALPRTSLATPDTINKIYSFLDNMSQLMNVQPNKTSGKSLSFANSLHSILARPTPGTDLQRRAILITNMYTSRFTSVEKVLSIIEDFTLMPIGIGTSANFSVLHSLATASQGRAEVSWNPTSLPSKIALQIQRSRQSKIEALKINFGVPASFWTPQPIAHFYTGDLVRAFAFFNNIPMNSPPVTAQLTSSAPVSFESFSTSVSIDFAHASDDSNTIRLLGCVERVFDLEDQAADAQEVLEFVQDFSVLTARTAFMGDKNLANGCHISLFSIPEWEGGIGGSGSGKRACKTGPSESRSPGDSANKIQYDYAFLSSLRAVNERPLGMPLIPGVTIDAPVSGTHSSSSPIKHSSKRRSSHNQGHHIPQKPKRPVLTIQGVWSDAKVDALATKPAQHYVAWFKNANSWLNKITKDNYERLAARLLAEVQTELEDPYSLKGFTGLVYEKAIRQTTYSAMYADLVRYLVDNTSQTTDLIRRSLLDKCRNEFELALLPKELLPVPAPSSDPTPTVSPSTEPPASSASSTSDAPSSPRRPKFFNSKLMSGSMPNLPVSGNLTGILSKSDAARMSAYSEDEEEKENKARTFRTGLVTFLGKLYKKGIVNVDITQSCIGELLSSALQLQEKYPTKSTECLTLAVQYIRTVGKSLHQANKDVVENLFQYIDSEIMENPNLDSRARILFTNLIELKRNAWIPRETQSEIVPQTLADIRRSVGRGR
jgi:hypothetical protein